MIEILLGAYNGERYIGEQVESILRQDYGGWRLTMRDDASTDGTLEVLRECERRHPDRISVQSRETNSGSASRSFMEMIRGSGAEHVMLSDQDDVWAGNKVSVTFSRMRALEERFGTDVPILVHTDLTVTDADLRVVAPSMMRAQQLDGHERRLARLLVQNTVTGCTVMVNRALVDLTRETHEGIVMHDWWLAITAAAFGKIGFVDVPTVLYRQHGANVVGARPSRTISYKLSRMRDPSVPAALRDSVTQAAAFLDHFEAHLSAAQVEMLGSYATIPRLGKLGRIGVLRRHGLWKNTLIRRIGQLVYV